MKRLLLTLALCAPLCGSAQISDLFQQALRLENSQGDLEGAIALYERIAEEPSGDRATAAQALYNLGQAYETLGRRDAAGAYERLISDYSDYDELATAARGRLKALSPTIVPGGQDIADGAPRLERFSSELDLWEASVSPDGNLLLAYGYGDLPIQDLRTGEVTWAGVKEGVGDKRSPRVGGDERNTNDWASSGKFSPDMSKIAYGWNHGEMTQLTGGLSWARNSINVIDRRSGQIKVLMDVTDYFGGDSDWPTILGWTPNGQEIIASVSTGRWAQGRMVAVNAATGAVREVLDESPDYMYCITGDGRYAIVGNPHEPSNSTRAARVDLVDGGAEWWPETSDFTSWLMGCDDDYAYRISDTFATSSLQRLPLENGMPTGSAKVLLQTPEHFMALGLSASGDLFLQPTSALQTYEASIDATTGALRAPVNRLLSSSIGPQDWSDDGSKFLNWSFGLCLRVIQADGTIGDCIYLEDEGRGRLAWMGSGDTIVARLGASDEIATYDITSGKRIGAFGDYDLFDTIGAQSILVEAEGCIQQLDLSSRELSSLYCAAEGLEFGRQGQGGRYRDGRTSPDGSHVAFRLRDTEEDQVIAVLDLNSGAVKEYGGLGTIALLRWHPDGEDVFYLQYTEEGSRGMLLDPATGKSTEWLGFVSEFDGLGALEFRPDGSGVILGGRPKGLDWRPAVVRNAGGGTN